MATILIVDDEALVRRTLTSALELAGHSVDEARDGEEALARLAAASPDLLVIDIVMPRREGIETIREVRQTHPWIPIVAISGGGSVGGTLFLEIARHVGADHVLRKPIRSAELIAAVEACLTCVAPALGR